MRIIPARAGFTLYASLFGSWAGGSSPLARGLREPHTRRRPGRRIIPARAGFTRPSGLWGLLSPDHPRSRGVYANGHPVIVAACGSSPLARGLQPDMVFVVAKAGIIPARAGFTPPPRARRREPGDHPRSRGVYARGCAAWAVRPGSSPLARGLLDGPRGRLRGRRIIPARAGFTPNHENSTIPRQDHPRSRGVYVIVMVTQDTGRGSSPLARGLLAFRFRVFVSCWIIPARAGFTGARRRRTRDARDHPRSRGVYATHPGRPRPGCGSSPLARGLRRPGVPQVTGPVDHPRSRGVYVNRPKYVSYLTGSSPLARGLLGTVATGAEKAGSSPLARGLPLGMSRSLAEIGIIPARAGFTTQPVQASPRERDHPRSRGVYMGGRRVSPARAGSSPLARGLRRLGQRAAAVPGIIPARAGFTRCWRPACGT